MQKKAQHGYILRRRRYADTFSAEGGPEGEIVGEERILAEEGAARILHAHHALTLPIKAYATILGRRLVRRASISI